MSRVENGKLCLRTISIVLHITPITGNFLLQPTLLVLCVLYTVRYTFYYYLLYILMSTVCALYTVYVTVLYTANCPLGLQNPLYTNYSVTICIALCIV